MMNNKIVFGIDIGGTTIKCGVFDKSGKLMDKTEITTDTRNNGEHILEDIAEYIVSVIRDRGLEISDIAGIGLGVPGAVDDNGTVNKCINLGWGVVNVREQLKDRLYDKLECEKEADSIEIKVGNDANVAALGEYWQGGAKGCKSIFMVTVGTGVGGGAVLDGRLINGFNGAAAEIGHLPIVDGLDWSCACGKTGCLEQVASATGIARMANMDNAKMVFDAAKNNDKEALQVIDRVSWYLAKGLACVAGIIDPECFVIGGGVSAAGDFFIEKIRAYYKTMAFHPSRDTKIVAALLGNDAGMYGAARLVQNQAGAE